MESLETEPKPTSPGLPVPREGRVAHTCAEHRNLSCPACRKSELAEMEQAERLERRQESAEYPEPIPEPAPVPVPKPKRKQKKNVKPGKGSVKRSGRGSVAGRTGPKPSRLSNGTGKSNKKGKKH